MKVSRGRGRRLSAERVGGPTNPGQGRRGSNISNNHMHDRRMEHIASVSRSSGLEKGGDL